MNFHVIEHADHDAWLAHRSKSLGGSDAAAILGMSSYATPYSVWLEKTGRTEPKDLSDNEAVYWGTVLEDVIVAEFRKRHPEYNVAAGGGKTYVSEEHPFLHANIDAGIITDSNERGILECKTAGLRSAHHWDEGIPDYYYPQVVHYLAVTGWAFAYVAVLIGGQEYREYRIERDEDEIAALIEREQEFWAMVKSDTAPELTGSKVDTDAFTAQHVSSSDEFLPMDESVELKLSEIIQLKEQIKELDTKKRELESGVLTVIGDAKGLDSESYRATWVRSQTSRLDSKRLSADHPGIVAEYTTTHSRNGGLRITEKGAR